MGEVHPHPCRRARSRAICSHSRWNNLTEVTPFQLRRCRLQHTVAAKSLAPPAPAPLVAQRSPRSPFRHRRSRRSFRCATSCAAMASMTFDLAWKEAMVELLDQLQELDPIRAPYWRWRLERLAAAV